MQHRNAARAFAAELQQIRRDGDPVTVRGKATHELLARSVTLQRPIERFITVPGRRNDVFATIAETMWVIAGRNDMGYLSRYLGRAPDFSDDGSTWRGGYGPRLRNWAGVDQLDEVRKLLKRARESRRAAAVLFDPARDFVDTLDVPCNNWLHFLIRDGRLHLNVALRSNDILWGFSGINTFEWSVVQEMMAFWLGVEVGSATFFISSLHLYDEYESRADRTLEGFAGATGYERGWQGERFSTAWEDFPRVLDDWFEIEEQLASGEEVASKIADFPDPLLRQFLQVLEIKWAIERGTSPSRQDELLQALGRSDAALALREQLFRDSAELLAAEAGHTGWSELREAIVALHRRKDASYGDSWKKRGELISIAANIARKIDRVQNIVEGASPDGESLVDTSVDLLVYSLKYEAFLADRSPAVAQRLFGRQGNGFSDGAVGFEELLRARAEPARVGAVEDEAAAASAAFDLLHGVLQERDGGNWERKLELAEGLSAAAIRLVAAVAALDWQGVEQLQQDAGLA
jgi:thymidylate synthase